MTGNLVHSLVNFFDNNIGKELTVLIISMLPILELRGGLLAASLLGMGSIESLIICFVGNFLPIPFILWLITPIFNKLKKTRLFSGIVSKLENKALSKRESIEKYKFWGLVLFVGIPLPGTGAWTGSLIASLIDMDKKRALVSILIGLVIASAIMMFISFGILKSII